MQAYHYRLQLLHCMQGLTCSMVSSDISYFTFCSQLCITAVSALNCCRTNKGVRDANTWNESHGPWHDGPHLGSDCPNMNSTLSVLMPSLSVSQDLGHHCQYQETETERCEQRTRAIYVVTDTSQGRQGWEDDQIRICKISKMNELFSVCARMLALPFWWDWVGVAGPGHH